MNATLTKLERKALNVALSGLFEWHAALRRQLPHLRVVSRQYTGVGFFANFECIDCLPVTEPAPSDPSERVPVAWAAHPDIDDGGDGVISFHVFLKDGVIEFLEGVSTSAWPETEDLITFATER